MLLCGENAAKNKAHEADMVKAWKCVCAGTATAATGGPAVAGHGAYNGRYMYAGDVHVAAPKHEWE